jgi:transcriptional regulator GlxA family with amidase domain
MVPINESDARRRLQAVVDHIESHLSEPLDVAALAGVAL